MAEVQKDATTVMKLSENRIGFVGIFLRRTHPDYAKVPVKNSKNPDSPTPFMSWTNNNEKGQDIEFNVAQFGPAFGQILNLANEDEIYLKFPMRSTDGKKN